MKEQVDGLSEQLSQWIAEAVGGDSVVVRGVHRLYGGVSSIMRRIDLDVDDEPRAVVLRQFDNEEWLEQEPDLARHEAEALRRAGALLGERAPHIIAYDESGASTGMPAVLMTRLEGTVDLMPPDIGMWLDELAAAIACVHAGGGNEDGNEAEFAWRYFAYWDVDQMVSAQWEWSQVPDMWRRAVELVRGGMPPYRARFIHRDYHPTNVLWVDGRVSGVVDWVNACYGPAGIDVGHCRVNLAQLYGVEVADAFLDAYQRHAGEAFVYDVYWDVRSLLDMGSDDPPSVYAGWTELGVTGLTDELIRARMDAYVASLLG